MPWLSAIIWISTCRGEITYFSRNTEPSPKDNKVRRRVTETRYQTNGTMSQVPTFSAGVSLYKPGESASAFIERADKALYRAKRLGRNRIELDMTYQSETGAGMPRRRSTD